MAKRLYLGIRYNKEFSVDGIAQCGQHMKITRKDMSFRDPKITQFSGVEWLPLIPLQKNCLARTVVEAPKSSLVTPILRSLH